MATHKIWKDLVRSLSDVHGERKAPPDDLMELIRMVEALEEKYLTFALDNENPTV